MDLHYIATGMPRSGTVYVAKLLTSLGVPCGHESIFDWQGWSRAEQRLQGVYPIDLSEASQNRARMSLRDEPEELEWVDKNNLVADSSFCAAPFLEESLIASVPLIHVVRNPLKVISSLHLDFRYFEDIANNWPWDAFIKLHLPEIEAYETQLEKIIYFYLTWNEMISQTAGSRPYLLYKVESPIDELCEFLEVDPNNKKVYQNRKANSGRMDSATKRNHDLTWRDLPHGKMKIRLGRWCEIHYPETT